MRALLRTPLVASLALATPGALAQDGSPPRPDGESEPFTFAVIGDFGWEGEALNAVAEAVVALDPDVLLTVGDNNYPDGAAETLDANVGRPFHAFIHPYRGSFGAGAEVNRFFPTLGNHDLWNAKREPYLATEAGAPILEWLELPGNERYYDFVRGPVHFFALSSDPSEPDGTEADSVQASWLRERLAASTARLQVVYMHHPPYSSGPHESTRRVQWPMKEWGVDLVLAGHDHLYERLDVDGLPHVTCGLGGAAFYPFKRALPESLVRFNAKPGFLSGRVRDGRVSLSFVTGGIVYDSLDVVPWSVVEGEDLLLPSGATWRYASADPGAKWSGTSFADGGWKSGATPFGEGGAATAIERAEGDPRITTWLRATVEVADPSAYDRLILAGARDDGIAVYVNGVEAYRSNLPSGALDAATLAGFQVDDAFHASSFRTTCSPLLLKKGANTIAVELHQASAEDEDASFDLELRGQR
jgi:hypothetical protein